MTQNNGENSHETVLVVNPAGSSAIVLVCEHASHHIPATFAALGLAEDDQTSHAAWDPGAMDVARLLSASLNATLIASGVSRLIYDCNRPPGARDAMPERSEAIAVPGNVGLSAKDRADRAAAFYVPFRDQLHSAIQKKPKPIIITIHSFTPIYYGKQRSVEIGVLHDTDARLADAMLANFADHTTFDVQRNAPYGASDGVTHTLQEHAIKDGHLNVMLEVRNDLIATPQQQRAMAKMLTSWITNTCDTLNVDWSAQCRV